MKQYDEIKYYGDYWGVPVIAFDKLDGSNLRFEFSHKRGFYKFGTREMMIDATHPEFGFACDIFLNKYADSLAKVFKQKQYRNILSFTCFGELIGDKSEFGRHTDSATFDIVLFDVYTKEKGLVEPKQFVEDFGPTGIPKIVYQGNLNQEFVQAVKRNEYGLQEGVIAKSKILNKKENNLFYCKIKTDDWFERLRAKHLDQYLLELKQANKNDTAIRTY